MVAAWGSGEARHLRGLPDGRTRVMSQPHADTNGRNLRAVLAPTRGLPSETVPDLARGLREEPRRRTARGIRRQADTDVAPGGERARRSVRRGRNVGTRLEDGDWHMGCVVLTDLPSRAVHNPVRTEADPEHRVALSHARPRPSGARGRIQARAPPGARAAHARLILAWRAPAAPGRCSPGPCARTSWPPRPSGSSTARPGRSSPLRPWTSATCRVLTVSRSIAETRRCRSATKGCGNLYGPVAAWRAHRAEGRECTGGV